MLVLQAAREVSQPRPHKRRQREVPPRTPSARPSPGEPSGFLVVPGRAEGVRDRAPFSPPSPLLRFPPLLYAGEQHRDADDGTVVNNFTLRLGVNTVDVKQNESTNEVNVNKAQIATLLTGFSESDPRHLLLRGWRDSTTSSQWRPSVSLKKGTWTSTHAAWVQSGVTVAEHWTTTFKKA